MSEKTEKTGLVSKLLFQASVELSLVSLLYFSCYDVRLLHVVLANK